MALVSVTWNVRTVVPLIVGMVLCACSEHACGRAVDVQEEEQAKEEKSPSPSPLGEWHASVDLAGGKLPFELTIEERDSELVGTLRNGTGRQEFQVRRLGDDRVQFRFSPYQSTVQAELDLPRGVMKGTWEVPTITGTSAFPYEARQGKRPRFSPVTESAPGASVLSSVKGRWELTFHDNGGEYRGVADLHQRVDGFTTGTFITPTGDFGHLAGSYQRGVLRLSNFNGSMGAKLVSGKAGADGTIEGKVWITDIYEASWKAKPLGGQGIEQVLPESLKRVDKSDAAPLPDLELPSVDGGTVSLRDARFAGKVLVIEIMGTWCSTCADSAQALARWQKDYHDDGLEILGIAFEHSPDLEERRRAVLEFKQQHAISYPLLLGGMTGADDLPELGEIDSFPTFLFVDRDGRLRATHTGFPSAGAGAYHAKVVQQLESTIQALLSE